MSTPSDILDYESLLDPIEKNICENLRYEIEKNLSKATAKIWHGHPVYFLDNNPIIGYSKLKSYIQLLFWSGQTFDELGLTNIGNFKAAEKRYTNVNEIDTFELTHWIALSRDIQWDYANIVKKKGKLERLK